MSASLALLATAVVLYSAGLYLLLDRSLTRVLLGVLLLGNATNVLLLASGGRSGGAPIYGTTPEDEMSDPLPQAMALTAIVITLGVAAFLLAIIYRSWRLGQETLEDDPEDRIVASGIQLAPDDVNYVGAGPDDIDPDGDLTDGLEDGLVPFGADEEARP
ncbi:Na(+)/H(+) antiporter subunit C [Motilibacter aurantiacus]|uniref:Na(+)/H(+) antiporter subunit C n=1 Tax=Motilibacter aurantiacus TaxID=2714955 RepID=UPI00140849CF|nr:Na(+)/H(+) antiporter subunit C [Motilibacter aurantiacus]NHC46974.1 Na(+)/H(+) antiporter subunit C [Motilibacter aurantiacus]